MVRVAHVGLVEEVENAMYRSALVTSSLATNTLAHQTASYLTAGWQFESSAVGVRVKIVPQIGHGELVVAQVAAIAAVVFVVVAAGRIRRSSMTPTVVGNIDSFVGDDDLVVLNTIMIDRLQVLDSIF